MASKNNNHHHKSIELSTHGILFLGTPHQGANGVDLANLLLGIQSLYSKTSDAILKDLRSHSAALEKQLDMYASISDNYVTKFFFELYQTEGLRGIGKLVCFCSLHPIHLYQCCFTFLFLPPRSSLSILLQQLVPRHSAVVPGAVNVEPIPLHKNHINMARFEDENDQDFKVTLSCLTEMVDAAPAVVARKWALQDRRGGI